MDLRKSRKNMTKRKVEPQKCNK